MMMALGVREWESELMAQLNELLPPPPTPVTTPAASRSSGNAAAERLDVSTVHGCSVDEQAPAGGRRRCRGSCKRARRHHHHHHHELLPGGGGGGGADANPPCSKRISRRTKEGVIKVETLTMPDFNGYQWRKYGQKQIEGAKYSRNYYRCTNSTDQGCPAKRTVQRDGDGDPPKYTVVHIGEHTCKAVDPVAPVILETTVRTSTNATAAVAHAGDVAVSSADTATTSLSSGSPSSTAGTQSPAISSGGNSVDVDDRYCCPYAVGDWFPATPPAPAADPLLVEMDLPIRSPVHLVADEWSMNELLIDDPTNIPSNWRYLFGF